MAPLYYGWRIVATSFITQCLAVGTVFYSFGVFFQPISEHFGWTRAQVSWGFSLAVVMGAVYAPVVGRIVDRRGPKPVQLVGALALATGFLALAGVQSLLQYYLLMGLFVALGSAALGPMPSNAAVARWFVRKRGRALGFATAGISTGGVVFVPFTAWMIDHYGWRTAFLGLATMVVGIGIPPVLRWMKRSPEDLGLRPDGDPPFEEGTPAGREQRRQLMEEIERSVTAREAIRLRDFWLIAFSFALTIAGLSAVLLHQIPYLIDQGMPVDRASWILSSTAAVGVVGKLGFGALIDRFDQRKVILGCFGLQALGVVVLLFARSAPMLVLFVVLYGYAMGGNVTLQATIVGERFGRLHYGSITGQMHPVVVTFQALGVPLVGWIRDVTESYTLAFLTIIAATGVAMACVATLRLPRRDDRGSGVRYQASGGGTEV